jgi:competence protein ComEA
VAGGVSSQLFPAFRHPRVRSSKKDDRTFREESLFMKKLVALFAALLTAGIAAAAVNINTATKSELEALPGVGPVRAQAIIDYRTKNGAFKALEDIKKVDGIGDGIFADNKGKISLSGPTKIDWAVAKEASKDAPKADAGKKETPVAAASAKESPKKEEAKKEEPKKEAAPSKDAPKKEMTKEEKAAADKAKKEEAKKKAAEEKAKKAEEKKKKAEEAKAKKEADAKAKKEAAAKKDAPKKEESAKKEAAPAKDGKKEEPKK